jgi:drug/metabolite transporter (DMT)-like permease
MAIVGSSVVVGKLVVARVPVFLVGGLRLAFACAVLVPSLLLVERGWPRLGRRDLAVLALQAFTGIFLFTALLLSGLRLTSAAAAGIVTSTTPAVAGALAALLLRERLTRARAGALALAVLGILAIDLAGPAAGASGGANVLLGNLLVFGAVVGEALFIVCGRVAAARVTPLLAATTLSVLGFVMFLPFAAREAMRFGLTSISAGDWVALAYYGLVVTVLAFVLWARGLAVVPASTAAVFTAVLPLSAVLLSYAVLGEPFAWSHLLGGACVIGGIALLAWERAFDRRGRAGAGLSGSGVPVE